MPVIKILIHAVLATMMLITSAWSDTPPIVITHSDSMPPLSFINEQGKPAGIIIDFWQEWAKTTDTPIEFKLGKWQDSIDSIIKEDADILGGLFYSSERSEFLTYGDSLFSMRGGLFIPADWTKENFQINNVICGVLKRGFSKTFMEDRYPFAPLMVFDSSNHLFDTVAAGRIRVFVADYPVAISQLNKRGLEDSYQCIEILYEEDLYPAVNSKNKALIHSINQGMASIPRHQKNIILSKWMNTKDKIGFGSKLLAGLSLLTLFASLFIFRSALTGLFRQIRRKK